MVTFLNFEGYEKRNVYNIKRSKCLEFGHRKFGICFLFDIDINLYKNKLRVQNGQLLKQQPRSRSMAHCHYVPVHSRPSAYSITYICIYIIYTISFLLPPLLFSTLLFQPYFSFFLLLLQEKPQWRIISGLLFKFNCSFMFISKSMRSNYLTVFYISKQIAFNWEQLFPFTVIGKYSSN